MANMHRHHPDWNTGNEAAENDRMPASAADEDTSTFHVPLQRNFMAASVPVAASFRPNELFGLGSADAGTAAISSSHHHQMLRFPQFNVESFSAFSRGSNLNHEAASASDVISVNNSQTGVAGTLTSSSDQLSILKWLQEQPLMMQPSSLQTNTLLRADDTSADGVLAQSRMSLPWMNSAAVNPSSALPLIGLFQASGLSQQNGEGLMGITSSRVTSSSNSSSSLRQGLESSWQADGAYVPGVVPETFPMTLHRLLVDLDSRGAEFIASFLPHGRAFVIKRVEAFERDVMPKYFPRMHRFASFQRQLNLYNFVRVGGSSTERGSYCHELFIRDQPELAGRMRRTKIKGLFKVPEEKRRRRGSSKASENDAHRTTG